MQTSLNPFVPLGSSSCLCRVSYENSTKHPKPKTLNPTFPKPTHSAAHRKPKIQTLKLTTPQR